MATPERGPEAVTRTVTIEPNYKASPPNLSVDDGDTLVFQSRASQDCSISFVPAGVLTSSNSITVPAQGESSPITIGQNLSETVDYFVQGPSGLTTGPYSVTVDNGPLPITVDSGADASPEDAAIPANGSLYFDYEQDDPNVSTLTVTFTYESPNDPVFYDPGGNPVNSLTLNPGDSEKLTARGSPQVVEYSITPNSKLGGGGTVKVGN